MNSEWDKYDEGVVDEPILLSDFEHKAHLISTKIKNRIDEPEDVISKELQLSFLDKELAYIYGIKSSCSEEWRNLGLRKLSKRRAVHLIIKMNILKSVGGFERILQTASASATADISSHSQIPTAKEVMEENSPEKRTVNWKKWFK